MTTFDYPTPWSPGRKYYLKDHAAVTALIAKTVICDNTLDYGQHFALIRKKGAEPSGAQIDQWVLYCPATDNFILKRLFISLWLILSAVHITAVVARERPDAALHHFYFPNGFIIALLSLVGRFPLVVVNHASGAGYYLRTVFRKAVIYFIRKRAEEIWYVSEPQKNYFEHIMPSENNYSLGNPVDTDRWTVPDCPAGKKITVLNAAMPSHRKGTDILIKAIGILKARGIVSKDNLIVHIVGSGPWDNEYKDLVKQHQVDDIIEFKGFLFDNDYSDEVQKCHFSILPSREESFSYAIAESLASGKPVVTTSCGGPEWFVRADTGIVVPADDLNAFVEAIERMLHTFMEYDPESLHQSIQDRFSYPVFSAAMQKRLAALVSGNT